jgi:hypothetical protein
LGHGRISLDDYHELRDDYTSRNLYLYIFEISGPRTFGETWAQGHLKELVPELTKPSRKQDPNYSGEYDFFLNRKIKIEVKASRAVEAGSSDPLYMKALASDSPKPFWMNFQQVKPACCDVFVWIAVWRDVIRYWVLSSHELKHHPDYSARQHRGNTGEGQLHVRQDNIQDFAPFEAPSNKLGEAIRNACGHARPARVPIALRGSRKVAQTAEPRGARCRSHAALTRVDAAIRFKGYPPQELRRTWKTLPR